MKYRREVDGLRAIAVLPVIFFHAGFEWIGGGFVGVDVFFVISGYLITTIILDEMDADRFTFSSFYERRARRILPALFFVLLCCLPVSIVYLLPDELQAFSVSLASVIFFISNIYFRNEIDYFAPAAEGQPLLHTWSLAVEEQYYLVFPVLSLLMWRGGRKVFLLTILGIAVASFLYADYQSTMRPDKIFYDTRGRVWELFVGSLVAIYLLRVRKAPPRRSVGEIAALVGLTLILIACIVFEKSTPFPGRNALLPTIGAALVILFASPKNYTGRLLGASTLVGIGLISYSAYLWHQPIFAFARVTGFATPGGFLFTILSVASLVAAYLTWRYIEQPFRDRQRISRRQILVFSVLGMLVFSTLGFLGYATTGFPSRFNIADADLLVTHASRGDYVREAYDKLLKLSDFDDSATHRVLVIGDSFSQDLVNIILESNLIPDADIRVRYIPARCQIYRGNEDVLQFVSPRDKELCSKDYYSGVVGLAQKADLILLTASWKAWSAERLPETIENFEFPESARVVVVGRKSFGAVHRREYIGMGVKEKSQIRNEVGEEHLLVNEIMKERLGSSQFINLHALVCGEGSTECPIFSGDGKLLSYDGSHLTKGGAMFVGRLLRDRGALLRRDQ
ncbi:acyltransferase family protein [Thiosocius teredinicola]|uniref:acyltransferase family protein n=1 Tax=Thiosocius teredinicola TaxID=1973002 RepID=UPI000990FDD8